MGALTLGPRLRRWAVDVSECITSKRPSVLFLDVSGLTAIDSAGLGELVILFTAGSERDCRLVLVNPPARISHLLTTTKLDGLLPQAEDLDAARRIVLERP